MKARSFSTERIERGGIAHLAYRITCAGCGAVAYYLLKRGGVPRPPPSVVVHFEKEGWLVGPSVRKDACPICRRREKPSRPSCEEIPMSANGRTLDLVANDSPRAETPRSPSIDDRRIITHKLTECYADGGYVSPWTDQRVAEDLGVPRAWVSEVREFSFGPEGSNPLFDDFLTAQGELAADCRALSQLRVEFSSAATEAERRIKSLEADFTGQVKAACRKLADLATDIRRRGDELDAKARDLAPLAKRVEREIGR